MQMHAWTICLCETIAPSIGRQAHGGLAPELSCSKEPGHFALDDGFGNFGTISGCSRLNFLWREVRYGRENLGSTTAILFFFWGGGTQALILAIGICFCSLKGFETSNSKGIGTDSARLRMYLPSTLQLK